ncbi:MAG: 3'-5' exoribonuclease [Alphaproteobacteria bacterium]|nr:3'-5' exoribonuclease [Alphaproteobacteria bacterium]
MSRERQPDEVYVSTDIEADGPIPGAHSMLSLGSVAVSLDGEELGRFAANLDPLPEARPHPRTMAWWETQPEAWEACRKDARPPQQVMMDYDAWLKRLPGRPVFIGYPLLFDMMFVYWYQIRFVGSSPFGHSGMDIKSLAWTALGAGRDGITYRKSTKRNMPKEWLSHRPHTHLAVEDAREQADLFLNIVRALQSPGRSG